jgi:hypothetical protein
MGRLFFQRPGGNNFLATKATGKPQFPPIRSGHPCRNAMGATNQQSMGIQHTQTVLVERAHDLRPDTGCQGFITFFQPNLRTAEERFLPIRIKLSKPNPEKRPLSVGVMQEVGITTIIRASSAGKCQLLSHSVVFTLESIVDVFQFPGQDIR